MLLKSSLIAAYFAVASLAAATPAPVSHVAKYDEFTVDKTGLGPALPNPYLDLVPKGWGVVSQAQNVKVGGFTPQSPKNYILNSILLGEPASFHVAAPYTKAQFQSFYFGFLVNDANGVADEAAPGTLTLQGYDKNGGTVPGAQYQISFQPTGSLVDQQPLLKATLPKTFPPVYNITFFYQTAIRAIIVDSFAYTVSK